MSSKREFDVIVFGASGFTGKYVVYELLSRADPNVKVAIAGRSNLKLAEVVKDIKKRGLKREVSTIIADVSDDSSLNAMCVRGNLVLNCVGPYRFFGEPVVKACVESGTDYLDITGEPEFIERMEQKYHEAAKAKGVLVVSACGFDSIPNDMGALFTIGAFPSGVTPSSIDSYITIAGGPNGVKGHYATYESAVHGFGSAKNLGRIRKSKPKIDLPVVGKKNTKHSGPFFSKEIDKYCLPFMGADASIVKRSQEYFVSKGGSQPWKPVQFGVYFGLPSLFWLVIFLFIGFIFSFLAKYSFGRSLLLKYPRLFTFGRFSHEGPSEGDMAATSFKIRFVGKGYSSKQDADAKQRPDFKVVTEVSGPEPGYIATPIAIVQAALTVLESKSSLPAGVLTTAAAFSNTNLITKLNAAGIKFKVVSSTNQ